MTLTHIYYSIVQWITCSFLLKYWCITYRMHLSTDDLYSIFQYPEETWSTLTVNSDFLDLLQNLSFHVGVSAELLPCSHNASLFGQFCHTLLVGDYKADHVVLIAARMKIRNKVDKRLRRKGYSYWEKFMRARSWKSEVELFKIVEIIHQSRSWSGPQNTKLTTEIVIKKGALKEAEVLI